MSATDAMLARFDAEVEERTTFINGLISQAEERGRDLTSEEMNMISQANARLEEVGKQAGPLREAARIAIDSRSRRQELHDAYKQAASPVSPGAVEYRTAGAYIADLYYGQLGDREAQARMDVYNRVAAHQTTTDNPGLLPETIVTPIINFVDQARPIVSTLGPTDLGTGAWAYATVTQHTQVGLQAGEKTELASRKMTITKTPLGADTYGGYVNVSKQDIARTSPGILDMVINDLAGQYAIQTESITAQALWTGGTAGPIIATGTPTPAAVASAIWTAAGSVFAATKGQGTTIVAVSPDMLGLIGPIFPPVNPTNGYSSGFNAGGIGSGPQGSIAGLTVVMSAGLTTGQILVYSTAAAKAFEYKYGNLQVVEPSVWGVQVGYAGDFDAVVTTAAGVVKVTKTP